MLGESPFKGNTAEALFRKRVPEKEVSNSNFGATFPSSGIADVMLNEQRGMKPQRSGHQFSPQRGSSAKFYATSLKQSMSQSRMRPVGSRARIIT